MHVLEHLQEHGSNSGHPRSSHFETSFDRKPKGTMRTRITTLSRRWLLLWALMFWQGGFTFYGGVVVPVGSAVLGSDREQGFITRSVTNYLNVAGAVALAIWCWELATMRRKSPGGDRLRWAVWVGLVLAHAALVVLHLQLDAHLIPESSAVLERQRFLILHEGYIFISSAQWAGCLVLTALTLWAWQGENGGLAPSASACP